MASKSLIPQWVRLAAWYCWIAPLVATLVANAIYSREGDTREHPDGDLFVNISFWVCISGLVLSATTLFQLRRHEAKGIVWMALIGFVMSCLLGFFAFLGIASRIARQ